jgi:hypothetical protein
MTADEILFLFTLQTQGHILGLWTSTIHSKLLLRSAIFIFIP